jgi:N-acetylglucosaminyl-diphospho-decaprenol L-rhamnosyltransferase
MVPSAQPQAVPSFPGSFGVVMVSYHTGPCLFDAINHVLGQDSLTRLVIVDNGNPPDIVEQIRQRQAEDSRLLLVSGHGNIGFGRGCNLGAKAAETDYLLFLNPDSELPDGTFSCLWQEYRLKASAFPSVPILLGARLLNSDGSEQRGARRDILTPLTALAEVFRLDRFRVCSRLNFHEQACPTETTEVPAISGAFMFLSAADFWRIGGFDERYFLHVEDMDLCLRFRRAGGQICFVPQLKVLHHGGTSDCPKLKVEWFKTKSFMRYFHQNFRPQHSLPFLLLLDAAILARFGAKALRRAGACLKTPRLG